MKYSLGTGRAKLNQGLGDLFMTMGAQPYLKQQAAQKNEERQLGNLFTQARTEQALASADKDRSEVTRMTTGLNSLPTTLSGVTVPQGEQLGEWFAKQSWGAPVQADGPVYPNEAQPMRPASRPEFATDDVMGQFNQGRLLADILRSSQSSNPSQITGAMESMANQGRIGDMLDGHINPELLSQAIAAIDGKSMYSQGASGVLNDYTGNISPTDLSASATAENYAQAGKAEQGQNAPAGYLWVDPANPAMGVNKIPGYTKGNGISMTTPDGHTFQVGGDSAFSEPTKAVRTTLQKDIVGALEGLRNLGTIADSHSDEYLTGWGDIKAKVGKIEDKWGGPFGLEQFAADRKVFSDNVMQFFNQYRKEITGAAASEKELEQLLSSMFNMNVGPTVFKASFNSFADKVAANLRGKQQALKTGISVDEGFQAPQIGTVDDGYVFLGGNPGDPSSWKKAIQ